MANVTYTAAQLAAAERRLRKALATSSAWSHQWTTHGVITECVQRLILTQAVLDKSDALLRQTRATVLKGRLPFYVRWTAQASSDATERALVIEEMQARQQALLERTRAMVRESRKVLGRQAVARACPASPRRAR